MRDYSLFYCDDEVVDSTDEQSRFKVYQVAGIYPAIVGMRLPHESKSDSEGDTIGPKDLELAKKLIKAGPSHRKFLRQIMIWVEVTACLKWWDEFDTYLHTVKNSTSQMHKLGKRKLTKGDFEGDLPNALLDMINDAIEQYQNDSTKWRDMVNIIPQSFLYTRMVSLNYETVFTMYSTRKNHKMKEWPLFLNSLLKDCPYLEDFIYYMRGEE